MQTPHGHVVVVCVALQHYFRAFVRHITVDTIERVSTMPNHWHTLRLYDLEFVEGGRPFTAARCKEETCA